ncbi:MAG: hypothetical protein BECKG1743D_GA0114223_103244 [Candidatus Kentron sp. G]|nr:MAG: hypothetical protein BECKG1743F_GA0114225_102835 [Candidatus Kentron sp. G]VFN01962.1 MAG: hypothetical protein BECKG1743D_GA0114223_103244 [Candidatus Kentron sp. G]
MPARNVLLDECVDWKLGKHITGHEVQTVRGAGWKSFKNGDLLRRAQADFDVLVTTDRSLLYQQNMAKFDIAVIVVMARSNSIRSLLPFVPELLDAIPKATPGAPIVLKRQASE